MSGGESTDTIVVSVGGSLIVPDAIDTEFLKHFRDLVVSFVEEGKRFFIVAGGGKVGRRYQDALRAVREDVSQDDLDWMGIYATWLNGRLMIRVFGDRAYPDVLPPTEVTDSSKPVTVTAGLTPGCSTDYRAVQIAEQVGASRMLNLSNIDYVYDKDPKTNADAQKIESISWSAFRDLLPDEWDPGMNAPFDPVAAKQAEALGLEVGILNGQIENIQNYFRGEDFAGTMIT